MGKEYLEAFETVYNNIDYLISDVVIEDNEVNGCLMTIKEQLLIIKQALQCLESIDNAKPSEALECWKWINATIPQWVREKDKEHQNVLEPIKQALLKAQEPKHYLKWEDLEFKEDNETKIKVRMGEHIYDLWYGSYKTGYGTFKQKCSLAGYEFDEDYDIDFFNDLHLERVE